MMLKQMASDEVPEHVKEELLAITSIDDTLNKIVNDNPRSLFDFFDEKKILIEIYVKGGFSYVIYTPIAAVTSEEKFATRLLAEKSAIEDAFEFLEIQLKPEEDAGQDSTTSSSEIPE